jgi:hypothetical protein
MISLQTAQRNPEVTVGRPPIGKIAMTSTERSHRHRLKLRQEQPDTKPAKKWNDDTFAALQDRIRTLEAECARNRKRIVELEAELAHQPAKSPIPADAAGPFKARIRELEAELARLRAAKPTRPESRGDAATKEDTKLMKLIRRLDSPENDHEAVSALHLLASELQARGRGFQELADLTAQWDQEDAAVRPPKPKPVDWPEVERAVATYAEGKTKVTMNKVIAAVYEQVPALKGQAGDGGVSTARFFAGCLGRLGFTASRSGMTYERAIA